MNPLDIPIESLTTVEKATEHFRRVKEFLLNVPDPNVTGIDGRTGLLHALALCTANGGEPIVVSLLERGADPNRPSPLTIFSTFMSCATSVTLLEKMIAAGLKLDGVYTVDAGQLPTGRG